MLETLLQGIKTGFSTVFGVDSASREEKSFHKKYDKILRVLDSSGSGS